MFMFLLLLLSKILLASPCTQCGTETTIICETCQQAPCCSKACQIACRNGHEPSCTHLKIKDSLIPHAGQGLFVQRDYAQDETIAVYGCTDMQGISDTHDPYAFIRGVPEKDLIQLVVGDPHPKDTYLTAQLANDGCVNPEHMAFVEHTGKIDNALLKAAEAFGYSYTTRFLEKEYNATLDHDQDGTPRICATRLIHTDEEVLCIYGVDYWLKCAYFAEHRGFAQEARQIYRAVSIGIDAALKNAKKLSFDPKTIFLGYIASDDLPQATLLETPIAPFRKTKLHHPDSKQS